jgi:hypothetical protein
MRSRRSQEGKEVDGGEREAGRGEGGEGGTGGEGREGREGREGGRGRRRGEGVRGGREGSEEGREGGGRKRVRGISTKVADVNPVRQKSPHEWGA